MKRHLRKHSRRHLRRHLRRCLRRHLRRHLMYHLRRLRWLCGGACCCGGACAGRFEQASIENELNATNPAFVPLASHPASSLTSLPSLPRDTADRCHCGFVPLASLRLFCWTADAHDLLIRTAAVLCFRSLVQKHVAEL